MTSENSPQKKWDIDSTLLVPEGNEALRLEAARAKYKELVGISPRIDKINNVEALEQTVSSAEFVASEIAHIRQSDRDDDQGLAWWQR